MSHDAKRAREAMKAKARRLADTGYKKVDSSDWSPNEPLNADIKTGMRPIGRRAYKSGGAVSKDIGVAMANKDMKAANEQREGKKHVGGMKDGGKLGKRAGQAPAQKKIGKATGGALTGSKPKHRKSGKTDIKINIISAGGKQPVMPPMPGPDGRPGGAVPVPMPPAAAAPMMPPAAAAPPPMPAPGGMPPGRKSGGRISKVASSYKDMEAGAVSGEGRLQKTDIAKKHASAPARRAGGRVAKSYRDMTAGADSGPGRLQKAAIEKSQRIRGK